MAKKQNVCISTHCPKYHECARAVGEGFSVNYAECGSGGSNAETVWCCGPNGNYTFFEPLEKAGTEGEADK